MYSGQLYFIFYLYSIGSFMYMSIVDGNLNILKNNSKNRFPYNNDKNTILNKIIGYPTRFCTYIQLTYILVFFVSLSISVKFLAQQKHEQLQASLRLPYLFKKNGKACHKKICDRQNRNTTNDYDLWLTQIILFFVSLSNSVKFLEKQKHK